MMQFYTYAHYKPNGSLFYIGKGHGNRAFRKSGRNRYWKNIVEKYGSPRIEILANWDTEKEALDHEVLLISCFKDMGYKLANITNGGEGCTGLRHTEEVKQRIRRLNTGHKLTPEQVEKIRILSIGRKHTQETKDYLKKINTGENNPMYGIGCMKGKKHTEETKRKLSAKKMGWKMSDEHRAILSATHKGKKQNPEHIKKRIASRLITIAAKKQIERKD